MWQQWRYFYLTVTALLALMYFAANNDTVTNAVHSLTEWIAVKISG